MQAIGNGDESAMAILIGRHIDALYRYASRLTSSPASAEDLVQDTWLAVWQKASSFKPTQAKLTTWLHRVLYNKYVDQARKDKLLTFKPDPETEAVNPQTDADIDGRRAQIWLDTKLSELPSTQRSAVVLAYGQGFGNKDIARIMGISVRAVESLLARARRSLKQDYLKWTQTND
ncbi:MAG: sigma-70 family RNA polymerase sigma factor [Pseudomonadota bacterium]|nr:sigma-70 family RNA polymerase sigma factor [Pseudomonadota bacterium]